MVGAASVTVIPLNHAFSPSFHIVETAPGGLPEGLACRGEYLGRSSAVMAGAKKSEQALRESLELGHNYVATEHLPLGGTATSGGSGGAGGVETEHGVGGR